MELHLASAAELQANAFYLTQEELLRRPLELGIAIDPENPAEIDDAIEVSLNPDGTYRVAIHVSDAGLLSDYDDIFLGAKAMGWTKYAEPPIQATTELMIPGVVSIDQLGLNSNHYNLGAPAVTIRFDFDPILRRTGNLDIYKSRVLCTSTSYEEFAQLMVSGDERALMVKHVATLINQDVDTPADFSESGSAKSAVGELMVAANRLIAEEMRKHGVPWLYRNHRQVVPTSMRDLEPSNISATIEDLLDAMGRARYSTDPQRHEGLNLLPYCHFTSPLRRFADLVNHITLHALLSGKPLPFSQHELDGYANELTLLSARAIGVVSLQHAA